MATPQTAPRTPQGYEELYRLHRARILRLCRLLLGDPEEAEDVTQEVFVALHREWAAPERSMAWGPWLTRVALNACHRRRRSRRWRWWCADADAELDETSVPADAPTPEAAAIGREQRERLAGAFHRLSLRQREVFVLRHVEGWSTQEVADTLGVDAGTVKLHLYRANRAFRKALGARP